MARPFLPFLPRRRPGKRLIFRASYTDRKGVKHYARTYKLRGFPIWV